MATVENLQETVTRSFEVAGISTADMVRWIVDGMKADGIVDLPANLDIDNNDRLRLQVPGLIGSPFVFDTNDNHTFKAWVNETD